MFLEIQKITTATPSKRSPIIVNSNAVITVDNEQFEDKDTRSMYTATRLDIIGYPKYTVFTLTTFEGMLEYFKTVDVTSEVLITGGPCSGGNSLDIVTPMIQYPLVKAKKIFNYTLTETREYAFNPTYIVYAEEVEFHDTVLQQPSKGMMIVLRDNHPKQILTKISYDVLYGILKPTPVPIGPPSIGLEDGGRLLTENSEPLLLE